MLPPKSTMMYEYRASIYSTRAPTSAPKPPTVQIAARVSSERRLREYSSVSAKPHRTLIAAVKPYFVRKKMSGFQ